MTATSSTFTPSTQILEAGEKAQALVDAGNALKPLLPEETQTTIEGIEKVANALNATGKAMQHFGFDEAEPEAFEPFKGQNFGTAAEADGDESVGAFFVPAVIAGGKILGPYIVKGAIAGSIAYGYSNIFGDEMEPGSTDVLTGNNTSNQVTYDTLEDDQSAISADSEDELVGGPVAFAIGYGIGYGTVVVVKAAAVGGVAYGVKKGLEAIFGDEMEPETTSIYGEIENVDNLGGSIVPQENFTDSLTGNNQFGDSQQFLPLVEPSLA